MRLAINSNLGGKDALIDKLIEKSQHVEHFHLYTSCEAIFDQAEYIRDGLVWSTWTKNVDRVCAEGNLEGFHMMCTVNALCLFSLTDFLDYCLELKTKYGADFPTFTLNILRFPSFQSPLVLPINVKIKQRQILQNWLEKNMHNKLLHEMEINQVKRLIEYLQSVETPHSEAFEMPKLLNDFKHFYMQYDIRRNKNFDTTFPKLAEWYNSI